jgi:hypothetical protein
VRIILPHLFQGSDTNLLKNYPGGKTRGYRLITDFLWIFLIRIPPLETV